MFLRQSFTKLARSNTLLQVVGRSFRANPDKGRYLSGGLRMKSTMKGLLYHGNHDLRYSDSIETPTIGCKDDVLIDVAWCGICGTDLHEYLEGPIFLPKEGEPNKISHHTLPICLGHEFSGIVKKVGDNMKDKFKPGDRVVAEASGHCSDKIRFDPKNKDPTCAACKMGHTNICRDLGFLGLGVGHGAFSERVVVGGAHVLKIPDNIPLDVAALVEPIAVAWHAVEVSPFQPGDDALVLGAGPIGLAMILALQGHNAGKIVVSEPTQTRSQQAAKLGAETFNPMDKKFNSPSEVTEALRAMAAEGEGFKHSYDCSGVPVTFTTSIEALAPKGVAVNVAVWQHKPVNHYVMDLTMQEKFATGSMGYIVADFEGVLKAFADGRIDPENAKNLITGKVHLENAMEDGFFQLMKNREKHIKILVEPK